MRIETLRGVAFGALVGGFLSIPITVLLGGHSFVATGLLIIIGMRACTIGLRRSMTALSVPASPRPSKPSGGHYHGDDECFCDQPKPCCDQGRVAYPYPCPWHQEL